MDTLVLQPQRAAPPDLLTAIEHQLGEAMGATVRLIGVESRADLLSAATTRSFWKAHALCTSPGIGGLRARPVLIRAAPPEAQWVEGLARSAAVNTYLTGRGLPVPDFYGVAKAEGWHAAMWEYRPGRSDPTFGSYRPRDLDRLARAVSHIGAATVDAAEHVALPVGVEWNEPVAERVRALVTGDGGIGRMTQQIDLLESIEGDLAAALDAIEPRFLTHNDLKAPNVLLGDGGEISIVDWDSATIGPPGASLRKFSEYGGRREQLVAERHATYLTEAGFTVATGDILFVMRAQQMLWHLVTGVRRGLAKRIAGGLRLVERVAHDLERRSSSTANGHARRSPDWLTHTVEQLKDSSRGRLPAPVPHPDFASWPAGWRTDRFAIIEPHLSHAGGTALDIGTQLGTYAHWLEDLGYEVTAVERSSSYAMAARELRDLCGKTFDVVPGSVCDLPFAEFDVVLALDVFDYLLRTEDGSAALDAFLARLDCKTLIFSIPPLRRGPYQNLGEDALARHVAERAGLPDVTPIGSFGSRTVYKISQARYGSGVTVGQANANGAAPPASYPLPAPEPLKAAVRDFMEKNRGRLYSPIPHPDFADWPVSRGTERFGVIGPHLDPGGGTALDVGTHFGTFAHWLEDQGYEVTAVEKSGRYAMIAREIRDLCGKRFKVVTGSIFDLEEAKFDVVLALNIFHHFLKTEEAFTALEAFLDRLECRTMIFQAHVFSEGQMASAYRNMEQDEFAQFVADRAGLPDIEKIGAEGPRTIYKLSKPVPAAAERAAEPAAEPAAEAEPAEPAVPVRIEREDIYLVAAQTYARMKERGFAPRKDSTPWPLQLPLDWAADPFTDPNWCSKLAHWRMTDPILIEHFKTGDPALLREAFEYALDWHRFHHVEGREAPFSWRDGPTGIRALRVAFFLDRARSGELEVTAEELEALHEMVDEHARRLQEDGFIVGTNHGLFQVFGLRLLASVAGDRPSCKGAARFAEVKFREILGTQFDQHGVHREHSPAYHFFVNKLVKSLGGTRHFSDPEIQDVLDLADRCEPWLVFPDGREPRVGDSSGGRHDVPAPEEPVVTLAGDRRFLVGDLTESGYAVVRSAPPQQDSMLFVTGMAHGGTHKHADDLSFELYERGRRVFVDGGKYGYFRNPMRTYVKGASAHNTISLAGQAISPLAVELAGSSLQSLKATIDGVFRVRGAVERPGLFRQSRTIDYDPGRFLVVRDHVVADEERTFVSTLLLAPDLVLETSETGFAVQIDEHCRLSAELVAPDGGEAAIEAVRGQESPLLGWFSPGYKQAEPATAVRAVCPGRERTIVWAVWLDEQWRDAALRRARRA